MSNTSQFKDLNEFLAKHSAKNESKTNSTSIISHTRIGDKEQNIKTIPTVFGKKKSWLFISLILYLNLIYNSFIFSYLFNNKITLMYIFIMTPQLIYLHNIKKYNYSNNSIDKYMNQTKKTLVILLLFLSIISLHK
jgi:4-hydroxybenzoate polyprenyltransferase